MLNVPLSSKPVRYLPVDTLLPGDLLLFEYRIRQSLVERGIRLVEGSKFVHCGTIEQPRPGCAPIVMEALSPQRRFDELAVYTGSPDGTVVHVLRPKFPIEPLDLSLVTRESYGYLGIVDSLINHGLKLVLFGHWRFRAMLGLLTPNALICSALSARRYRLDRHADWCPDYRVVEPDDYYNHPESFDYLGRARWAPEEAAACSS
jgi:hypothetical protein